MSKPRNDESWADIRKAAHVRDQHQCVNCLMRIDDGATLDPDHTVPRGVGGSNRLSNISTLCRRCHLAKHGEGVAPTVQIASSGDMTDREFMWYRHLLQAMIPQLAQRFDVSIEPKFGLIEDEYWFLPIGDLQRLDQQLHRSDEEDSYTSFSLEQYM